MTGKTAENRAKKIGIRRKFTQVVCIAVLITMSAAIALTYVFGKKLLYDTIGAQNQATAHMLGMYIATQIDGEVEDVSTYSRRQLWRYAVEDSNVRNQAIDADSRQSFFAEMDQKWVTSLEDDPLVKEFLKNNISSSMREIQDLRSNIAEIFITDRFGALVAASEKTTDFYQADEPWWQAAYNSGAGALYIGDVEFDESSQSWVVPIAIPIKDQTGYVVGICKQGSSIQRLCGNLGDFKIGKTGHALLVETSGIIIFHQNRSISGKRIYGIKKGPSSESATSGYGLVKNTGLHGEEMLVAFAPVSSRILSERGIRWTIFIEQTTHEAFSPIRKMTAFLTIIMIVALLIVWPFAFIIAGIFVKPIEKLREATEHLIAGQWDYPISVKTGDEIEEFSEIFSSMVTVIRTRQAELVFAKEELEKLSRNLELKVADRTKDLSLAQEATLNILEDLTEAKLRIEKESRSLAEALEIKSSFTSTVSHELRTPLAAIKEGIAIVLDGTAGNLNKEQTDFLVIAKRNVDRLTRLINDVLDFQKLERRGIPFNMALNDINETVKEVASSMLQLLESKGMTLTLELDDDAPKIVFDKDRIVQVLTNLVGNSVKFTETGGVTLTTSRNDNFVQISVADTGQGIAAKDMPRLFKQFDQIQPDIKRKVGGTGLGLAICKGIIEAHNGKIWAESVKDKGSVFSFILPIRERRT